MPETNSVMNRKIEQLFDQYQKAANTLDFKTIASFYTNSFISAGPKGSVTQSKQAFFDNAETAADFYKKVGQTSIRILSLTEIPISEQYVLAKVHWGATFLKTGDKVTEFNVSYLVQLTQDEPQIALFIAHEDEEIAMRDLGILN